MKRMRLAAVVAMVVALAGALAEDAQAVMAAGGNITTHYTLNGTNYRAISSRPSERLASP